MLKGTKLYEKHNVGQLKFNIPSCHNHTKANAAWTNGLAEEALNHEQRAQAQAGQGRERNYHFRM